MTGSAPLVVGVDGSRASVRALRWALEEARRRAAPLRVVMAWQSHAVLAGPAPILMQPELAPNHLREEHMESLGHLVHECMGESSTPQLHMEFVEGHAAEVLVNRSAGAAMLVLGDRGRGRMTEAVLGGTAQQCLRKATCPVLIVPSGWEGAAEQDAEEAGPHTPVMDPVLD